MTQSEERHEPFSYVDAAWLHMEEPTSMAMITGVIMFDEPVDFAALKKLVKDRLLRVPRFRQRVREPRFGIGTPRWEPDPHFDLDAHLHRIALPAPHDQAALQDLVGDLMSTPLDFNKPLWQYHLVENFEGGSALICRLHHAMGDGLALVQVLLTMADNAPSSVAQASQALVVPSHRPRHSPLARVFKLVNRGTGMARELVTSRQKLREVTLLGASGSLALAKLLFIGPDQSSLLKGQIGVMKRAAWTKQLPLADVKTVAHAMDGTVNDVLITAVTGALRRYLDARGDDTTDMNLRALVPVNLRAPGDLDLAHLGNRFGLVFLSLPVGIRDPLMRMAVLKERMDEIKHTPEAAVAFGILNVIGATPVVMEHLINTIFGMKASAVMTNVPGPREPLFLTGRRIRNLMFWVPTPAHLAFGVSIISYAGQVCVGVGADAGLVPDPPAIVEAFDAEFAALAALAESRAVARLAPPSRRARSDGHAPAAAPRPRRIAAPRSRAKPSSNGHAPVAAPGPRRKRSRNANSESDSAPEPASAPQVVSGS